MKPILLSILLSFLIVQVPLAQNTTYYGTSTGTAGNLNSYFGYYAGKASTSSAAYNGAFGASSLANITSGTYNSGIGYAALNSNTTGGYNTAVGYSALASITTANYCTAVGLNALRGVTGSNNTGIGLNALYAVSSGSDNTASGYTTLQNNTGSYNSAFGSNSLFNNTSGGNLTAGGYKSLFGNTTGSNNTAFGYQALLTNTTGSNNTALGYGADVSSAALTNATALGNGAIATSSNAIQLGNSAVTQVYAGTGTAATLIAGGLKITGGTPAAGKVLTSDASGNATWQTPSGGGSSPWAISGATINYTGSVGIGTLTPAYPLDVSGTVRGTSLITSGLQVTGGTIGAGKVLTSDASGNATWQAAANSSQWTTNSSSIYFNTGNVGIGSQSPDYKLTVNGTVHCSEVKVDVNIPPDYVFEEGYKLRTLEEVKKYIDENKHLPEVPSAKEMEKTGVSVGEMNMLLLKKVEELTLYLLDLKKENEILKTKIEVIEKNK